MNLTIDDLEVMTIGNCLDYIQTVLDMNKKKENEVRKANQKDFDSF
ncbi:hypothetical protein [Bacillus sp. SH5-2]|nr:hypothetical protein [Bacillus sp. SH5-2]